MSELRFNCNCLERRHQGVHNKAAHMLRSIKIERNRLYWWWMHKAVGKLMEVLLCQKALDSICQKVRYHCDMATT